MNAVSRIPVLLVAYNRPDSVVRALKTIKNAGSRRLYVAVDGPKAGSSADFGRVAEVLRIIGNELEDEDSLVRIRERNLGLRESMIDALDWFFSCEESGIVLEDDCIPQSGFFDFCDAAITKYAENYSVGLVTGTNLQHGSVRGEYSAYFSRYAHVWGWATWASRWRSFDRTISFWPRWDFQAFCETSGISKLEGRYWVRRFRQVYEGASTSWAYAWLASMWFHRMSCVTPNIPLVENIGVGIYSTHTKYSLDPPFVSQELSQPFLFSENVEIDRVADSFVFENHYGGREMRFPGALRRIPRIPRRVWRWIQALK